MKVPLKNVKKKIDKKLRSNSHDAFFSVDSLLNFLLL